MAVQVLGIDYENQDGMASTLAATFKANRENGDILLNLEDAAQARREGRKDGPKKNQPRPPYVHRPYPKAAHHPDGRTAIAATPAEFEALEDKGFRAAPYPVVRVTPADPAAEKAARVAQDLETAGKIASQNDMLVKLQAQLDEMKKTAKAK